ncbi:MAG: hypothetical protein M5U28_33345 [Sandaracinaceae bacterium]|nr:hypothetical protein [Sandaracinaceae bacterium]
MRRLRTLGAVLVATLALAGCEEPASLPDGGDAAVRDAGVSVDAAQLDAATPEDAAADAATTSCAGHHDCEQGAFCHRGTCRTADVATYHCGRPGCPPGRWCVESDGRRGVCAEDPTYACTDACDCGPAHCCVDGRCVADDGDPWRGGGGASACPVGPEVPAGARLPTYCARDPECFAGAQAWAASGRRGTFLALSPDTGEATSECGAERCFGTACNCAPGESCVDTIDHTLPGATCGLDSGGTCVSNALAESVFGFAPSELLSCCDEGCLPGERCEMGWMRSGNRFAYQRITAVCADPEECSCGDGTCCPSEIRSCPADCMPPRCEADGTCTPVVCGDGRCDPFEDARRCSADCADGCGDGTCRPLDGEDEASCATDCVDRCGDGWCSAAELTDRGSCPEDCADRCSDASTYGRVYRVCGDGVCDRTGTCDYADVESCATCPQDCGACEWEWIRTRRDRVVHGDLQDVWVVGPDDVYVAADDGNVFHYDGAGWHAAVGAAGPTVWAAGPRDVFTAAFEVRYFDGSGWGSLVGSPDAIRALGGTRGDDVWALTGLGLHHYDGHRWTRGPALSGEVWDVWAASETELFVTVDSAVLHFVDDRPTRVEPAGTWPLYSVSGASRSDVFVAGGSKRDLVGVVAHFDGSTWTDISPPGASVILDVWAAGGGRAFAIDYTGALLRYDGAAWTTFPPLARSSASPCTGADRPTCTASGATTS